MTTSITLSVELNTFHELEQALNEWVGLHIHNTIISLIKLGGLIDNGRRLAENKVECQKHGYEGDSPDNRFKAWTQDTYCQKVIIPFYEEQFGKIYPYTWSTCRNIYLQFHNRVEIASRIPRKALMELAAPRNDNVRDHVLARLEDMDEIKGVDIKQIIEEEKETHKPPPTARETLSGLKRRFKAWMEEKDYLDIDRKTQAAINKLLTVKVIEERGADVVETDMHQQLLIAEPGPSTKGREQLHKEYIKASKGLTCPMEDREALQGMYSLDQINEHGIARCKARLLYVIQARRDFQDTINKELMDVQGLTKDDFQAINELVSVPQILAQEVPRCRKALTAKLEELKSIDLPKAQDRLLDHMEKRLKNKVVTEDQRRGLRTLCSVSMIRETGEAQCMDELDGMIDILPDAPKKTQPIPAREQPSTLVVLGQDMPIPKDKGQAYTSLGTVMLTYDNSDFTFSVLDTLRHQAGDDDGLMEYLNHIEKYVK